MILFPTRRPIIQFIVAVKSLCVNWLQKINLSLPLNILKASHLTSNIFRVLNQICINELVYVLSDVY